MDETEQEGFIQYERPFPPMADQCPDGESCCKAERGGWLCTRIAAHPGRHEAGGAGGEMFAACPRQERS